MDGRRSFGLCSFNGRHDSGRLDRGGTGWTGKDVGVKSVPILRQAPPGLRGGVWRSILNGYFSHHAIFNFQLNERRARARTDQQM